MMLESVSPELVFGKTGSDVASTTGGSAFLSAGAETLGRGTELWNPAD